MSTPRHTSRLASAALALVTLAAAACSDSGSTPAAPEGFTPQGPRMTVATSQVTTATLYPQYDNVYVSAEGHRITIPANSICKVGVSGYGPTTWNLPCAAETSPIVFTIKSTVDANGRPTITVHPDVRFSPSKTVTASFVDQAAANKFNSLIQYCATGSDNKCVDESLTDASLKTYTDKATGRVFRRLRHFSGYTVIVGADGCEDPSMCEYGFDRSALAARASGYITTTGLDGGEALAGTDRSR